MAGQSPRFPKMRGRYTEFAELVREITGPVAAETAAARTDVSHDTIRRMWAGERTTANTVRAFARGYRVDPLPLLLAARLPLSEEEEARVDAGTHHAPALVAAPVVSLPPADESADPLGVPEQSRYIAESVRRLDGKIELTDAEVQLIMEERTKKQQQADPSP